jgi:hypothetical protein
VTRSRPPRARMRSPVSPCRHSNAGDMIGQ